MNPTTIDNSGITLLQTLDGGACAQAVRDIAADIEAATEIKPYFGIRQ